MTFNEALKLVGNAEGKWTNDPRDVNGGLTVCGISRKQCPDAPIWNYVDRLLGRGLSLASAEKIARSDHYFMGLVEAFYRGKYWNVCKCDDLPNLLRYPMFSAAVNIGHVQASKILQRACGAKADGKIGAITLRACFAIDEGILCNLFCERWRAYYRTLVKNNPKFEVYAKGWQNRVSNVVRDNH